MVLSKREKHVAIVTGAALGIFVLYQFALSPYLDQLDEISHTHDAAAAQLAVDNALFERQKKLGVVWDQMLSNGLKADESQARSQAEHALVAWSKWAGIAVTSSKSNIATKAGGFLVLSYEISGNTTMSAAARMLWSLEQASIPFRVNEIQLSSRPEGTDSLSVRLNVSTLCMPAGPGSPPRSAATTQPGPTTMKSAGDQS